MGNDKIIYFFRSPKAGYSIQTVFQTIMRQTGLQFATEGVFLPSPFANLKAICQNGIYAQRHQQPSSLNHITGDVHYLLFFLKRRRTIVTVHDIMCYHNLKGIKKFLWKHLYIYPLKRAAHVTFISEHTCQQVLKIINISPSNYSVIPNPVDERFHFTEKRFNEQKPRILHIGVLERKNLARTIRALSTLNHSCHLRIIGKLSQEMTCLLKEKNIDYSNAADLSPGQMVEEYRQADIINFPSLAEGFGMPIIEGQASGRVVITSALSPMQEIAGEGAAFVNPFQEEDIRQAYINVIDNKNYRENLIQKGLQNAAKYKTDVIVRQYIQIYKSFCHE